MVPVKYDQDVIFPRWHVHGDEIVIGQGRHLSTINQHLGLTIAVPIVISYKVNRRLIISWQLWRRKGFGGRAPRQQRSHYKQSHTRVRAPIKKTNTDLARRKAMFLCRTHLYPL